MALKSIPIREISDTAAEMYRRLYTFLLPIRPIFVDDGSRWQDPLAGWLAVSRIRAAAARRRWGPDELKRAIAEARAEFDILDGHGRFPKL